MSDRYDDRLVFTTSDKGSNKHLLEERGVKSITFYSTAEFAPLTKEAFSSMHSLRHIWTAGDRYYKLSYKHYGSTKYWWVIAKYNQKPTESHVNLGDELFIPFPLQDAIEALRS